MCFRIFNYLVMFGSWSGHQTKNSITYVGWVMDKFETFVIRPVHFVKILKGYGDGKN